MLILILVALACIGIFAVNRFRRPNPAAIEATGPQALAPATGQMRVLTWNLGYAALGRNADMFTDGGRSLRALSKPDIARGAEQIAARLAQGDWDVICLQENAGAGFLTRGVDLKTRIGTALASRKQLFWADLKTVLLPPPVRITHGMSNFLSVQGDAGRVETLPDAETLMAGLLRKSYVALISRVPIAGTDRFWVIYNIHLPVFKTTQAARVAQLGRLFDTAQQEYQRGNHVVLAGDWNTRLCPTDFAHDTAPEHLSWLTDFPPQSLPPGWQIVTDPASPSFRSMHEPYVPGRTYCSIFDGFCISPNIRACAVKTHDLGFAFTDHHPVEARFTAQR